jgi:transposase-like protein
MNLAEVTKLNEEEAREYLEAIRWPSGPVCPFCGIMAVTKLQGKSTRPGVYKCKGNGCRKKFTVTVGSIFERSHIKLREWVIAFHLMCSSKKGISAHQLHRSLGITYKSAWFMCHRIRHAMSTGDLKRPKLSGVVEADETYVGGKPRIKGTSKPGKGTNKAPVVALVERDGTVRVVHMPHVTAKNLRQHIRQNLETEAVLNTDESPLYTKIGREQAAHNVVKHRDGVYAKGDAYTNTVESFFALIKRGIYGNFHHCSKKHLQKYCNEFAFRWDYRKTDDSDRRDAALSMAEGKRLTYKQPIGKGRGQA